MNTGLNHKSSIQEIVFKCQRCDSISKVGATSFGTLLNTLPNLKTLVLDLQKCKGIDDHSITNIADGLQGKILKMVLLEINLRDTKVTPKGLKRLSGALSSPIPSLARGTVTNANGQSFRLDQFVSAF